MQGMLRMSLEWTQSQIHSVTLSGLDIGFGAALLGKGKSPYDRVKEGVFGTISQC